MTTLLDGNGHLQAARWCALALGDALDGRWPRLSARVTLCPQRHVQRCTFVRCANVLIARRTHDRSVRHVPWTRSCMRARGPRAARQAACVAADRSVATPVQHATHSMPPCDATTHEITDSLEPRAQPAPVCRAEPMGSGRSHCIPDPHGVRSDGRRSCRALVEDRVDGEEQRARAVSRVRVGRCYAAAARLGHARRQAARARRTVAPSHAARPGLRRAVAE